MDHMTCVVCRVDTFQVLDPNTDSYKAVCADCGPYRIDKQVLRLMDQGRRLHGPLMKKWIASVYDWDANPYPEINMTTTIWAD
ncbi:MAG: hypothetical protein RR517_20160 [Pseudomonas sp.]